MIRQYVLFSVTRPTLTPPDEDPTVALPVSPYQQSSSSSLCCLHACMSKMLPKKGSRKTGALYTVVMPGSTLTYLKIFVYCAAEFQRTKPKVRIYANTVLWWIASQVQKGSHQNIHLPHSDNVDEKGCENNGGPSPFGCALPLLSMSLLSMPKQRPSHSMRQWTITSSTIREVVRNGSPKTMADPPSSKLVAAILDSIELYCYFRG